MNWLLPSFGARSGMGCGGGSEASTWAGAGADGPAGGARPAPKTRAADAGAAAGGGVWRNSTVSDRSPAYQ